MAVRLKAAEEKALLARLLAEPERHASGPAEAAERHAAGRKPRKGKVVGVATPATARRHCVECGAIVGKGRKALTCAVCDLVAALRAHGPDLPAPAREERFHDTRRWRFDLAFVGALVAVECDGGQFVAGGGRHNTDADREKLNHAAALGWRVLRFSPQQIAADPAGCVALVRQALEAPDAH